ncbi:hypothetical protein CfE428DRAFT_6096 [Chthoniobacter flavus Ellin428]|uniref:Uncharacterized protein n=1 Tax=Chthoniobacter flavus Ellin428 TaxID=497964 RepID=B4DB05_9BACT|nr:hypothetical protein [Chthoniobacter flavus]EDY16379.1 hypothetical protein CfE428DRAFT_6096 [Chthoniobacter flavus Ellin428]TCO92468.1 hypothetical protein EV701_106237 [Chthoniobacter flavus]
MSAQLLADILATISHTRFHAEARLLTWHPRGLLDDALADEVVDLAESETFSEADPFRCFTDFSGLTEIRLKIGHVFRIAEQRHGAHEPMKSAFFADTVVGFGIAHLYVELMKGAFIEVRAFRERSAAAEWLGVPVEILQPEL